MGASHRLRIVLLVAAATLVTGCGLATPDGPPDLTSSRGVRYYNAANRLTVVAADEQEEDLLEHYADPQGCLSSATVELVDQRLHSGGREVDGLQDGRRVRVYAFPSRLAPWSWLIRHELLHWLKECHSGDPDRDHRGPEWIFVGGV